MSLDYDLSEVPFSKRAIRLDLEYARKIVEGLTEPPRDYYVIDADSDGIEPGVYMMTQACFRLIWLTMAIGLGRITEKNWRTFYARVYAYERITGAERFQRGEDGRSRPQYFTAEEIRSLIGLGTNASRLTDAEWRKHITGKVEAICDRECRNLDD